MSLETNEQFFHRLDKMQLDHIKDLIKKAENARTKFSAQLEDAEKENYPEKATYIKGVIDGLNILLGPLE